MQVENTDNFNKRSEFLLAQIFNRQKIGGLHYGTLKQHYMISIVNYKVFDEHENFFSQYKYRDDFGNTLNGGQIIFFMELPKLPNKPIAELNEVELWGWFFLYANDKNKKQELKQVCNRLEGIKMAHEILAEVSKNPQEIEQFEAEMRAVSDQLSILEQAKNEGLAEGEHAKAIEVAREMLSDGFSVQQIVKFTKLSIEEIKKLSAN
jgi:predicted transposase/invertase (TIGR01784 family)